MVLIVLFACITLSLAQSDINQVPQNVITVPPNCPTGQEWVNGACHDIWSWRNNQNAADLGVIDPSLWSRNVITVPTNCPPGQQLINGVCRDVWKFFRPTTPLPKYFESLQQELRETRQADEVDAVETLNTFDPNNRQIISIPNQCPAGYKPDALGYCREILN